MASVAIEASIEVAEVAAEAVAETVAETVAGEEENQLVLPCFTRQPRVHIVALNIMEECRVHVTWHHIGNLKHLVAMLTPILLSFVLPRECDELRKSPTAGFDVCAIFLLKVASIVEIINCLVRSLSAFCIPPWNRCGELPKAEQ